MKRIIPDRPLTSAERQERWYARQTPEQREARLVKNRAQKNEAYASMTDEQKLKRRIRDFEDRSKRIERGGCESCGKPQTHGIRCEFHFFKMVADNHKLSHEGVEMIRQLWSEQSGRCALSGMAMSTNSSRSAMSASLDHKIPKSKGGGNNKENLQWILYPLNVAKADHSSEEFVELCRSVTEHAGSRVVALRKVGP